MSKHEKKSAFSFKKGFINEEMQAAAFELERSLGVFNQISGVISVTQRDANGNEVTVKNEEQAQQTIDQIRMANANITMANANIQHIIAQEKFVNGDPVKTPIIDRPVDVNQYLDNRGVTMTQ